MPLVPGIPASELSAKLESLAKQLRDALEEIGKLQWQILTEGLRPTPKNRKSDDDIPF